MTWPQLPVAIAFSGLHSGEFTPPVVAGVVYLALFARRARTLARQRRPVATWRAVSFASGVALMVVVQLPPFDDWADQVLITHMIQHILIGDIASLLMVFGLTGPVLSPLLHIRLTRPLRTLASPVVALVLWTLDMYGWHVPFFYQLAIRHDLVHALEHMCFLWFGLLLWLGLIGPLPKPAWFTTWGRLLYVVAVRLIGAVLGNVLIWTQTLLYPVYKSTDVARGLNPLSDQNLAGGVMMVEEMILTIILLGWLFYRFALQDEQRQALMDLADGRGIELSDERAARAAQAGAEASERLRERLLAVKPAGEPETRTPGDREPTPDTPSEWTPPS